MERVDYREDKGGMITMSAPETYHHESIVNFHTIHSILIIYPDGKKVFDSMLVSEGKTVKTPTSHKKELLKKAEEEKEAEDEEAIREMNDDELLQAIDNPQTVMGLALEREVDRYRYRIVEDELKQRGLIRMTEEETKETENEKTEAERREMLEDEARLSMSTRYNKTRNLYTQVCDECGYRIKDLGVNDEEEKVSLHTHCIVKED